MNTNDLRMHIFSNATLEFQDQALEAVWHQLYWGIDNYLWEEIYQGFEGHIMDELQDEQ